MSGDDRIIVGIDHGFAFPLAYTEKYELPPDWDVFLDDFAQHWPTDEANTYVDFVSELVSTLPNVAMKVIRGQDLEAQGFGGIWNVGKGNTTNPPALVVLSHRNEGSEHKSVVLVGKGIVYDTGGLAIKPREGMCAMKADMSGSAAMLSAFTALVRMGGLPSGEPLHCVLCLAENSVGPDSFRNDDIIRIYSYVKLEPFS